MLLSVIIPTYKEIEITEDCLRSIKLFNDIGSDLEVIVSDNSEDTALVDRIKVDFPWVTVIKNKNEGFGAACNRGYESSQGRYLLFLNPDTILIEPVFSFAIEKFENDNELALFGLQLLNKDGSIGFSFAVSEMYSLRASLRNKRLVRRNKFVDKNMFISGANLFIRRDTFEQAGRFDENIFMYREEADLIRRIKTYADAKKIAFFKEKKIIHLGGATEQDSDTTKTIRVTQRVDDSDAYLAKKFGFDYKKILKYRIRVSYMKKILYSLKGEREYAQVYKELTSIFKEKLRKIKKNKGY